MVGPELNHGSGGAGGGIAQGGEAFIEALTPVLERVCRAFDACVAAVPARVRTAADLRRALDLDTRLSTQIVRIARSKEPIAIASQVPGRPSLKRFLERAAEQQVPESVLREVDEAVGEFERFVQAHAGDRVSFDSIVSNLGAFGQDAIELQHRRAAFRAMSHLLGMQLGSYTRACIFRRGIEDGLYDMAQVRGFADITRLRPGTPVPLFSAQLITTMGDKLDSRYTRESVFPEIQPGLAIGAVPDVCDAALGSVRVVEEIGLLSAELHGDGLGNLSATELYFTYVERSVPVRPGMPGDSFGINHSIAVPAERFVLDLIIEKGQMLAPLPLASVFLNRTGRVATVYRQEDLMPIRPDVRRLRSMSDLTDDDVPAEYPTSVEMTVAKLGWSPQDFEVYRVMLDYPVFGTLIRVAVGIADQNANP